DGIRDFHVTGVQTCALPIYWSGFFSLRKLIFAPGLAFAAAHPQTEFTTTSVVPSLSTAFLTPSAVCNSSNPADARSSLIGFTNRSEERRVGKECRSRWCAVS